MFDHAPSTPQLKPDTYATCDLPHVAVRNGKRGNRGV